MAVFFAEDMQKIVFTPLGPAELHCEVVPNDDLMGADAKADSPVACNGVLATQDSLPARLSSVVTGVQHFSQVDASPTADDGSTGAASTRLPTRPNSPSDDVMLSQLVHEDSFLRVFDGTWGSTNVTVTVFRALRSKSLDNTCAASAYPFLRHPNIVQTFTYKELETPDETAAAWMIQEWCDRSSLSRYCCTPLPITEVLDISFEIASACCYLHSCDIIHGSLVADNVLLKTSVSSPKGYVCKVSGFGDSQTSTVSSDDRLMLASNRRQLMHLPAETRFAADALETLPTGRRLTRKSDVFDFGLILWRVVCCKDLFKDMLLAEISLVFQVNKGLCPSLPEPISEDIKNIYESCTASHPEARPDFATVSTSVLKCGMARGISAARAENREDLLLDVVKTASEEHATDWHTEPLHMHTATYQSH